jgi:glycosyltransferase involved in cell wall biosynthesis
VLQLHASLDSPLPTELVVGRGTALFVAGTCFCREGELAAVWLTVDGDSQPLIAYGMPRIDFFASLHPGLDPYETGALDADPASADDPHLLAYRSGFWGLAALAAGVGERTINLEGVLVDGRRATARLAAIRALAQPAPLGELPWPGPAGDRVAVCMATYNPPAALLKRQLDSIREQTHANWVCVISDDCSSPDASAALRAAVGDDPRFVVDRAPRRLGHYRNFERAISLAPRGADFIALSDQDDSWHPDKLATLLRSIGDAQLVYSDARIVDAGGNTVANTYWSRRANNHSDLLSLLVANSVTGAASLFRSELSQYALPFPPAQFAHFHDHWLALTALATGEMAYVPRPLYDYVQHGGAALGHETATQVVGLGERLRRRRPPRERVRLWRLHYFVDVCRLLQLAAVLELRCGAVMTRRKRRALRRFTRADGTVLALVPLAARGIRDLRRDRPETLGAEWMLSLSLLWRRLLASSARSRPQRRLRLDAVPPPSLLLAPTRGEPGAGAAVQRVAEKVVPLELSRRTDAPRRVNVLIPTIDLDHLFGGYIAKFNLALRLAERGHRVRIVTVDPVPPLPPSWRARIESYSGLRGLFDRVEVEFARGVATGLEVSDEDSFVASTWWTALIAAEAARTIGRDRFVYLIQEYEPFTFPMGTFAALAQQSYAAPHFALFSSELLRGYFHAHRIGVYAAGKRAGDAASASFQNAITDVPAPTAPELAGRRARKLLFYARPEEHAARNMFELGVLALGRTLSNGALDGWALNGIGAQGGDRRIPLGSAGELNLLPRAGQGAYATLLRDHDIGLALMYTPHPSLVPIEMASAGMVTVTNTFENKTAAAMAAISANIVACDPTVEAIAAGIADAAAAAGDYEWRAAGAGVEWNRDWADSFDDALLRRLERWLSPGPA